MTALLVILAGLVLALALGLAAALAGRWPGGRRRRPAAPEPDPGAGRILFPFVASALSRRALDAALRLARAEGATLVPVFLARVPMHLPLESALPRQGAQAISLQEAIEQRAAAYGVPVDSRLERGRSLRHALRQTIAHERFERIVVAAATTEGARGLGPDDVAWLLAHAPGEIVVLRPGTEDQLVPIAPRPARRASFSPRGGGRPSRPAGALRA